MPSKIPSHDEKRRKRMAKMSSVKPFALDRARKYRSSSNWQKVAGLHKSEFPLCYDPFDDHSKQGTSVPMAQVHHIFGLATHYQLRAHFRNLASLCTNCHSKVEQMERNGQKTQNLFKNKRDC